MKGLHQKHHGLPGVGVTAPDGERGEKGSSIRIGFINDFFDTYELPVGTFVKMARRTTDSSLYNTTLSGKPINEYTQEKVDGKLNLVPIVDAFSEHLSQLYIGSVEQTGYSVDINSVTEEFERFIRRRYNSKSTSIYYTGRYFDNSYYGKYVAETTVPSEAFAPDANRVDIDEEYMLTGGQFQVGPEMRIQSTRLKQLGMEQQPYIPTQDTSMLNIPQDSYQYRPIDEDPSYLETYTYRAGTTIPSLDVSVSLEPLESHYAVTYDLEDAAYMSGGDRAEPGEGGSKGRLAYLAYVDYIDERNGNDRDAAVDMIDDPLLTSFVDVKTVSGETQYHVDEYRGQAGAEPHTYSPFVRDYPDDTDIDTGKLLLSTMLIGTESHISRRDAAVEGGMADITVRGNGAGTKGEGRKYMDLSDRYQYLIYTMKRAMKVDSATIDDYNLGHGEPNPFYDDYITDFDDNLFVGFDYYGSAEMSRMLYEEMDGIDFDSLFGFVREQTLFRRSNAEDGGFLGDEFEEIIEEYVGRINVSIAAGKVGDGFIRWHEDDVKTISIPTTLRSDIRPGDTLYFRTDKNGMAIEYMVTVTEDMLGCNVGQLLEYSTKQVSEPFNYRSLYGYDGTGRVSSYAGCNVVRRDDHMVMDDYDVRSQMNILCGVGSPAMYVGSYGSDADAGLLSLCPHDSAKRVTSLDFRSAASDDGGLAYSMASAEPVKMSSLYVSEGSTVNAELDTVVRDRMVVLDAGGNLRGLDAGDFEELESVDGADVLVYRLSRADFVAGAAGFPDYAYGYTVFRGGEVVASGETMASMLDMSIRPIDLLDGQTPEDGAYATVSADILLHARNTAGLTYYSRLHRLSVEVSAAGDIGGAVGVEVFGEAPDETTGECPVTIDVAGIGCDELGDGERIEDAVVVKAPEGCEILDVLFNNESVATMKSFSNDWITVRETMSVKGSEYRYAITSMTDNIPDMRGSDASRVDTRTTDDYMLSGSDSEPENLRLFTRLAAGDRAMASPDRRVLVTVRYVDGGVEGTAHAYVTQPGFSDPRSIPQVEIGFRDDILSMEHSNDPERGVLCNQLQVFADVRVTGFGKDDWGRYARNMSDAVLDLTISNIDQNIDFINKYAVTPTDYTVRSTVKMLDDSGECGQGETDLTAGKGNNYVKIHASLLSQDVADPTVMTFAELCAAETSEHIWDGSEPSTGRYVRHAANVREMLDGDYAPALLLTDTSLMVDPNSKTSSRMHRGVSDYFEFHVDGVTMEEASKGFVLRFVFEFGQPVPANIYMRLAVTSMRVRYRSGGDERSFTLDTMKGASTYLSEVSETSLNYRFCSGAFDAMVNPLSYTACPESEETELRYVTGAVKKVGDEAQVKLEGHFYMPWAYESDIVGIDPLSQRDGQMMDWSALRPKARYMQDNVRSIVVSPFDLAGAIESGAIDRGCNAFLADESARRDDGEVTVYGGQTHKSIRAGSYLALVYRESVLNPKLRNDVMTFIYNDKEYLSSKYSQYERNLPVFVREELDMEVRDDDEMKSIDVWNFEYKTAGKRLVDNTFLGVINTYGNGYAYLDQKADTGQYGEDEAMSLADTKAAGERWLYGMRSVSDVGSPAKITDHTPDRGKCFRSLLYDASWEYPLYDGDGKIYPYQAVSPYDYATAGMEGDDWGSFVRERIRMRCGRMMPHNLMYKCSPRCMMNDDHGTLNVLMLRKPTVGRDGARATNPNTNFTDAERTQVRDYSLVEYHLQLKDRLYALKSGQEFDELDLDEGYDI